MYVFPPCSSHNVKKSNPSSPIFNEMTDGDNDWMDVQGGHDSAAALAKAGNSNCSVHVVPDAGHHLYLDNPEVSNKLLDEAIRAVPKAL